MPLALGKAVAERVVALTLGDLCGDDRAMLYGALLQLQDALAGEYGAEARAQARRRSKRASEAEGAGVAESVIREEA